jgi:hypothetical protein
MDTTDKERRRVRDNNQTFQQQQDYYSSSVPTQQDAGSGPLSSTPATDFTSDLSFIFRQAALRCMQRFSQQRITAFALLR